MWQTIVVGLIVLSAALYAAWVLLPAALRLRLAQSLAAAARRRGAPGGIVRLAGTVERAARRRLGGCSDCGAIQTATKAPRDRPRS